MSELLDTNVLVYAYDLDAGPKHFRAKDLIRELALSGDLVVSVQNLNELYNVLTRRIRPPSTSVDAAAAVQAIAATATVLPLTSEVTLRALDAVGQHGMSFWDALIWAVAREHAVRVIHSEDFQHNRVVDGVRFSNPFHVG